MYEKWIYQIYNLNFTGLHNIWYALFDFEFEKNVLLNNPIFYSIGMQSLVFNLKEFWIWVIYACLQALMVLLVLFYASQDSPLSDGLNFTFWAGGHHVYGACVVMANLIILKMQHNWMLMNLFIMIAQISCYYVLLFYFSIILQTDVIYRFGEEFVSSWPAWLGFAFCCSSFWHIDNMLHALRQTLANCFSDGPD